jgi:hypothetical protein
MKQMLAGLPWRVAMVYIDDILVSGRTFEEHLGNLRMVFERLTDYKPRVHDVICIANAKINSRN